MKSSQLKGYGLALIGAIALANSFIFSKAVLNQLHFVHFGLLWFSAGLIWLVLYIAFTGEYKQIRKLKSRGHLYTFLVGIKSDTT